VRKAIIIVLLFLVLTTLLAQIEELALIDDYAGIVKLKMPASGQIVQIDDTYKGRKIPTGAGIETGKNAELRLVMNDGTRVNIKEQTNTSLWSDKNRNAFGANLALGILVAKIVSDEFKIRTPIGYEISGKGATIQVRVDKDGRVTVFCIEGFAYVFDPYGGMVKIGEGQSFMFWYDKARDAYMAQASEYNESAGEFVFGNKKYPIEPGGGCGLTKKGEIIPLIPPPPPARELVFEKIGIPKEPKDEPYEDSGEMQEAPYVSPKKP